MQPFRSNVYYTLTFWWNLIETERHKFLLASTCIEQKCNVNHLGFEFGRGREYIKQISLSPQTRTLCVYISINVSKMQLNFQKISGQHMKDKHINLILWHAHIRIWARLKRKGMMTYLLSAAAAGGGGCVGWIRRRRGFGAISIIVEIR